MNKKAVVFALAAALLVLCAFPAVSLAADGSITTGGTYDISAYSNSGDGLVDTLTINTTDAVTLTNTSSITATDFQIVCAVGGVSLTLSNVNLDDNIYSDTCPLTFTGSGNTLTLAAGTTSTLIAGSNKPAVCVESATELTICGSGTLIAYGGAGGASIGGCAGSSGGTISFINSTVQATGCGGGAGIGGGISGSGGTIRITSGTVSAGGGNTGAGIGGGEGGSGGTIFITGGSVLGASDNGAGIGGGEGSSGGTVDISGGTVEANGGTGGAGIGGGKGGTGGIVNITNGTVTTQSVTGAGIGAGEGGGGCTVSICGGTVEAASGWGYDIGSGESGATGGTLNLDGAAYVKLANTGTNASVTIGDCYLLDNSPTSPLTDGAYLGGVLFTGTVIDVTDGSITGGGASYSNPTVTISDSSNDYLIRGNTTSNRVVVSTGTGTATDINLFGVSIKGSCCALDMSGSKVNLALYGSSTLSSGSNCAGLQCPDGAAVTISGDGSLGTKGGSYSAGIGGGRYQSGGNITISGGTILAEAGGAHGAGIGGGAEGGGGNITITGGIVTAKGHSGGAGIGSGIDTAADAVTNITISNGTVTAIGQSSSAGIGGGGYNIGEMNITITGGTVTASGPDFGAGIGGGIGNIGISGGGGNITISGGDITATGGETSPGIGNGAFSAAEAVTNIAISGGKVTATSTGSYTYSGSKTSGGAAIGSGYKATGCNIAISGGEVTATAGIGGAGIGGGVSGSGGAIDITGGTVYAAMGPEAIHDIGTGLGGTDGSLSISGTAAVFLKNKKCITPVKATHSKYDYTGGTSTVYGLSIPSSWSDDFSAWLKLDTLTYNANGGSGTTPVSMTQLYTTTSAVADGSGLSRAGYTYSGWNTKADGTGASVAAGDTFTFTEDTTLFAKWTANAYTVRYDANGGTGTIADSGFTYDTAKALTANGFTRTGYAFAGWAASADGPVAYSDGQSVKNLTLSNGGAVTLYAKWTANAYTVRYDANGGTGTMADSSFTYDAAKALTANGFTRTGYAFAGWAASADGPAAYSDGQSVKNLTATNGAAVTLYAKWTARPTLTPSLSGGQIYVGGRVTLTPNIPGGAWSFDTAMFSQNGSTFTALKSGFSVITYTVDGVSVSFPLTAKDAELPKTGQDTAWIFVLSGLSAVLAAAACVSIRLSVRKRR